MKYNIKIINKFKGDVKTFTNIIYNNFIYLKNFPDTLHTKEHIYKNLLSNNLIGILVYNEDNNIIGYLIAEYQKDFYKKNIYISYLYIHEKYRKLNIGTQLIKLIIKIGNLNKINKILLTFDTYNIKLHNFYKRFGFNIDSEYNKKTRHNVFSLYL